MGKDSYLPPVMYKEYGMKLVFQILGLYLSISISAVSAELKGILTMNGSILETPCAIAMESIDQSIDLGVEPISVLKQFGQGTRHPFSIKVIDCRISSLSGEPWNTFSITFSGPSENNNFLVFGDVSGIALRLEDEKGQWVIPNQPISLGGISQGDRLLNYGLRMISDHSTFIPGNFQSILSFKLDYY